jgi:poly(3-hydroxybutyrate) depolymerase
MNKFVPVLTMVLLSTQAFTNEPAPAPKIDTGRITVSGISSGGQMATQLHIAYSDLFSGVGIISSGPFGCAEGTLGTAMARCMGQAQTPLPIADLADSIRNAAMENLVANPENLADDPVWLFHGTLDTTVGADVNDATEALYSEFVPVGKIAYVKDIAAGHNFPTRGNGGDCTAMQPPFVGNCDYDAAGAILQYLYTGMTTPGTEVVTELQPVSLAGAGAAGLSDTAYLFVPPACANGSEACALHLVLHGCAQSAEQVGTDFITQSGYLPWAEANNIVLAFPQVIPSEVNPYACWDWWGYTGDDYRWRSGKQMKVVTDWIKLLSATPD